jgi:hypothetical protein
MSKVHQFRSHTKPRGAPRFTRVAFTQDELRQVFDVYSRRVSAGEWRDYAIGHYDGRAVFSVFRHTADHALYAIEKQGGKGGQFVLMSGRQNLKKSSRLGDVLAALSKGPRLVVNN